jgi:Holliday junction resolvase-like predicted endonuclease
MIKKEAEKILKYKDLTTEIQRMWNVKTGEIPVIIGATRTISK